MYQDPNQPPPPGKKKMIKKLQSEVKCSCCNAPESLVEGLVEISKDIFICDKCSETISDIFELKANEKRTASLKKERMYPKQIKKLLDEVVIGQEDAKKALSVEVYNHYKRVQHLEKEIQKSNILMIGDSGTGKTLLVQTLSKILDLPMAICDCAALTQAGYVGADIETILQQLVMVADNDIAKAEKGIILLDEFDKLAKRNLSSSTDKDPSGEGVQQGLLKIIEGTQVKIKIEGGTNRSRGQDQFIDTTNILFIAAGAFFGIDKVLEKNHASESAGIGFAASVDKVDITGKMIDDQDIIEYGFIPEIVGRMPTIVQLHQLTKEDYRRILTEPKNSVIHQYQKLMEIENIDLQFTPAFLDGIVEKVYNTKRGARALRSEIEKEMRELVYELNDDSYGQTIAL